MFEQKLEQKEIKGLLRKYLKFWYWFLIGAIISVGIAVIYLRYATPQYSASTTLLFKDEKGGGLSESSAFSDIELLNTSKSIDNEILVLKSWSLMTKVIVELRLDITYVIEGQIRDVEMYGEDVGVQIIMDELTPAWFGKTMKLHFKSDNKFDIEIGGQRTSHEFGKEVVMPFGTFTIVSKEGFTFSENNKPLVVKFHDAFGVAKSYANRLSVRPVNSQASVLAISLTDPVPEKAKDILVKLMEVYDREAINDKNQIASKTVEFIEDRLTYLMQELTDVESNVEEYMQEKELADVSSQAQAVLAQKIENRKEVEEIDIQLAVLNEIDIYVKAQKGNEFDLVPTTLSINDLTLSALISRYNDLQLERERRIQTGARPNNPSIVNINDQLANIRENIIENLNNIKNGLRITRRNLLAKSGIVGDQLQQVPTMERQLLEITREQEIKKAIYLYLLQKKEESALSLAAAVSNTRVIDPPLAKGPVSPVKSNILAYSLLVGLFVPFLGTYLRNLLTNRVESKREVEKATRTPILGEICHDKTGSTVVAGQNTKTPISEMFRLLRTNLHFSAGGKSIDSLLVTSSMSGEGKSFFCVNIGTSIAGTGKRVLILEFDLRRPKLMSSLNIEKKEGLTDYLVGDVPNVESIISKSGAHENLDIIGAGTLPPNPAEIMLNEKVADLFERMKKVYDFIIIDTAPVGKVADALSLKDFADTSIYIVRYNYTDKDQLQIIEDIYANQKLTNPLIVLNDAKKSNTGSYTYGY